MSIYPIMKEEHDILMACHPTLNSGFGWDWNNDYWFIVDGEADMVRDEALESNINMIRVWIYESDRRHKMEAAAPDMYEALKSFPGFTDDATIGDKWLEKMRMALAKADGK